MALSKFNHHVIKRAYTRITPFFESKKKASYLTITLSLFSLSFFGLLAIRPTLITAVSLIKSVSDLQKLDADYEQKISSIIRAQSEYEKIRDKLPFVEEALPINSSFSKVALGIEKFAQTENITINQFQIDSAPISVIKPQNKIGSFNFHLISTGDFPSVWQLLSHIINWKRIITINSLELSESGSTESAQLRMTLKGTVYYEP